MNLNPWRLMRLSHWNVRLLYALGLGPFIGEIVLLLTTTGRKTGKRRITALQYEEIDGVYYLGSARGAKADWFRNILANPLVEVRVKNRHFTGRAEPVTDPTRMVNFLETRLQRHPRMIGMMMKMHHLPNCPTRAQLEQLAKQLTVVAIHPKKALK